MKDWLLSGRFHRNRDVIFNLFWIILTAFIIGLLIGSEYNENGAGASLMKRCVAVEGKVLFFIAAFHKELRIKRESIKPRQTRSSGWG
jgi:hypothetical protein